MPSRPIMSLISSPPSPFALTGVALLALFGRSSFTYVMLEPSSVAGISTVCSDSSVVIMVVATEE